MKYNDLQKHMILYRNRPPIGTEYYFFVKLATKDYAQITTFKLMRSNAIITFTTDYITPNSWEIVSPMKESKIADSIQKHTLIEYALSPKTRIEKAK